MRANTYFSKMRALHKMGALIKFGLHIQAARMNLSVTQCVLLMHFITVHSML